MDTEAVIDALAGTHAQRDYDTLKRIEDEVQSTVDAPTEMDYFRAIVNDQDYQNNLWEDVWDMTHP